MKIALVYDRVNKFGGAEQVLLALHRIWPDAPLFTSVYDAHSTPWANDFTVIPSWLNHIPFAKHHHELFPWLTPIAFESFTFDSFDIVISVTSAEAKGIITKPGTIHICYCLTPTRYLWSGNETYRKHPGLGAISGIATSLLTAMTTLLRSWDLFASARPDYYLAISSVVKSRIQRYYSRRVEAVVFPPVDTNIFTPSIGVKTIDEKDYYLVVSRLVGYKRVDLLIQAFNRLGLPLIIIGDGHERARLKRIAKKNISFLHTKLTDKKLAQYYQHCKAFVYAGEEDFGIVAAEAQACGKPVIAYKNSGISDIVDDGKTGILFEQQTVESIIEAVHTSQIMIFDAAACRIRGLQFSEQVFQKNIQAFVEKVFQPKLL